MTDLDIGTLRRLLADGDLTVTAHVQSVLDTIERRDSDLGAFIAVAGDEAVRAAERADTRIREHGRAAWDDQPLLGVTIGVKDLIQTGDLPTTRGSLLDNPRPRRDAPAVARLRAAGAIIVGKTTTSEYGWSASTVSPVSPPTRNPWAPTRTAGGSSGGSAAAVAAGFCSAALGTDGAGSIRIPAAFCGIVGYKPSLGRVPYVPPCADRLAHLGPMARNVSDVVQLARVLAHPHRDDPDSTAACCRPPVAPGSNRIGWLDFAGTTDEVRRVCERATPAFTALGYRVEPVAVPFPDPYPALVDIIAASEAAGTAPDDDRRCDPGRMAIVRYGRSLPAAAVMRAEQARLALRGNLGAAMARYDLLAMATVGIEPFGVGAIAPDWAADPESRLWLAWSPASYPFNLTGQPAISLPAGTTRAGLPVGLQLVGASGADDLLLSTAARVEAELGYAPPSIPITERAL